MKVVRCEILEVDLPFKISFKHSLHERTSSGSIFVRMVADSGEVGWGESLPREYVTGETGPTVVENLKEAFLPPLFDQRFSSWEESLECAKSIEGLARVRKPDLPDRVGSSRCAAELA